MSVAEKEKVHLDCIPYECIIHEKLVLTARFLILQTPFKAMKAKQEPFEEHFIH